MRQTEERWDQMLAEDGYTVRSLIATRQGCIQGYIEEAEAFGDDYVCIKPPSGTEMELPLALVKWVTGH